MLGLVLGHVCHIGDSSVARDQLRSSRMLEFLVVLVVLALLVPCTNHISDSGLRNQGPAYGPKPSPTVTVSAPTQSAISFLVLSGYFGAATPAGG